MNSLSKKYLLKSFMALFVGFILIGFSGCNNDEPEVRSEEDILGVWTDNEGYYMQVQPDNRAYSLYITEQDGETIGRWDEDGFFYEPGYNLVISMDSSSRPQVYQVLELNDSSLVWCWVDDLASKYQEGMSAGEIIGEILQEAQEGYEINPEFIRTFTKISDEEFYSMLESLNIFYPWG